MKTAQKSKFYRSVEFAFSLRSWKRSFTVPFKRMGLYSRNVKESATILYGRYDGLEPADTEKEVVLAIKKSKSSAIVNLCFAAIMATVTISKSHTAESLQIAACVVVMLVFSLRFIIDIYIIITGTEQIREQRFPVAVEDPIEVSAHE